MAGLPATVARLVADASGYVAGTDKAIAATKDWQLQMDKADLTSRKMAVSAEAAAQRAAGAQEKLTAATEVATRAEQELAVVAEQLAAGQITAAEAAEREAVAQTQLAEAQTRGAAAAIQLERASIAQAEAQTRSAVAARESSAAIATSNEAAATRSKAAWASYSGVAKLAVAVVGYEAIKSAGNFQKATQVYTTAANETAAGLKVVRDGILEIASSTGAPIHGLTDGMYTIEKAGYRAADGLQILKAAAQGAAEENANLGTVTNAMTSIMASYHLKASDSVSVMNELKAAAGESKVTMENFAGALSTVLPLASANHIAFADVAGAMSTLTQHGTSADQATQELAFAIRNLSAPNMVASKEMAQLGLNSNDVSQKLGQRGLTGTIDLLSQTVLKQMGPAGLVLLNSFNQSKVAAQDAQTMLAALPPEANKVAAAYAAGSLSLGDYRKAIKALPAPQAALVQQFKATEDRAKGFNQQLRAGVPGSQTYTDAMKKMMGGANGLNVALQITGESLAHTEEASKRIADAAHDAGTNVQGWEQTQKTFNNTMDRFKETVGVLGIKLGTDLLPVVTKVMQVLLSGISVVEHHGKLFRDLAIAVGAVVLPMYALTKAVAAYNAVMRGVAAVQAVWVGMTVMYERVTTSVGTLTGATIEMEAAQARVQVQVEALSAEMGGLAAAETEAGGAATAAAAEFDSLATAEAAAGTSGEAAAGGIGAAGAASGAAGAEAGAARTGFLGMGAGMGATVARTGAVAAGLALVVGGIHEMTSGQKAGNQAAREFTAGLNTQHGSLQSMNSAIADTTKKISQLKGPASFGKSLGGMLTGGLFGDNPIKVVKETNDLQKQLGDLKAQTDRMRAAEGDLGKSYNLTSAQIEQLAAKYHIDLSGSVTATEARFASLTGQMGVTKTMTDSTGRQVTVLTHDINGVPHDVRTQFSTPGLPQALADLAHLDGSISRVDGRVIHITSVVDQANVNVVGPGTTRRAKGGLVGFAEGGIIRGPGTGTSDSILGLSAGGTPTARVSDGEFVVNAKDTAKNLPLLKAINDGGSGSGGGLGGGYQKLTTDVTGLSGKTIELTKRFTDQTKAFIDQNKQIDDGHTKLLAVTDATNAHHTAVDALIPRVTAGTNAHVVDYRTVDGLTGGYHTLTDAIARTPTAHHTNTDAPGAVNSTQQIRTLDQTIQAMRSKTDHITIDTSVSGVFASLFAAGGRVGYATGGQLYGPGTGTSDSIPIMASHGEFVVNARDTARTLPLLEAINAGMFAQGGMIKHLAAGGSVSDPTSTNAGQFASGAAALLDRVDGMLHPKAQTLIEHRAAGAVKKKIDAMSAGVGGGVARWTPLVLAAMGMLGLSPSLLPVVLSQMNTESGGNPGAINLTDSNAAAGHPSQGLMQVIPGTFAAYAGPFAGRGILDPFANIYAALNYARSRYGAGLSALGHGHGYASGGLVTGSDGVRYWGLSSSQIALAHRDLYDLGFAQDSGLAQADLGVRVDRLVGPQTLAALQYAEGHRPQGWSAMTGDLGGNISWMRPGGGSARGASRPAAPSAAQLGLMALGRGIAANNAQLAGETTWGNMLSGAITQGGVTKRNAWAYDAWASQTAAVAKQYAARLKAFQPVLAAHRGDPGYRNLNAIMSSEAAQAQAQAVKAAQMEQQARARVAGQEAVTRTIDNPTSRNMSWAGLHAPGPSHAVIPITVKIDGKKVFETVQKQSLRNESRNLTSGLSRNR